MSDAGGPAMAGRALDGRVVLVTGGGAGIGRGVVEACLEAGATVAVGTLEGAGAFERGAVSEGMPPAGTAPAGETLPGAALANGTLDLETLDVADPHAIDRWVDGVRERRGRVDGIVANAGVTVQRPFLEIGLEDLERLWRINQRGTFLAARAAARRMVADGTPGSIVAIASNHARASDAGYEMYAATKGAIVAMCRAMAWSLGPHGIRANSLSPGLTRTAAVADAASDPALERAFRAWHATGRYNTVREVGDCAAFLLSDAASSVTGADLLADQGMSARLADFP